MTDEANRIPLIGEHAPAFEAETTQGHLKFPEAFAGKWVIFSATRRISPRCAPPSL